MNVKNNKRRLETQQKIEAAFCEKLQHKSLQQIEVSEICETAQIERSTFYAHHTDVYALAESYCQKIEREVELQPHGTDDFAWIFEFIKDNLELFDSYFKIGICGKGRDYKETYFRNGVYGIARLWFEGGCEESPQIMGKVVERECIRR